MKCTIQDKATAKSLPEDEDGERLLQLCQVEGGEWREVTTRVCYRVHHPLRPHQLHKLLQALGITFIPYFWSFRDQNN